MQLFQMSPLQFRICAVAALAVMLAVFEIATRAKKKGRGGSTAPSLARTLAEGGLILATGAMIVACLATADRYAKYGAFYDESWRMPEVEDHFGFTTDDTERLQKAWSADPDGFDFTASNAIIVKLGCKDCEEAGEALTALYETGGYDVVFSNSDVGRAYAEYFGITYVPSVIYSGTVIELRTGSSQYDDGQPVMDAEDVLDMSGQLGSGSGDGSGEDEYQPGTKTEAEIWRQREEAEKAGEDGTDE